jgi:hypothetical protein
MIMILASLRCIDLSVGSTGQFGIPAFIGCQLHINIIFKMGDFAAELLKKLS